jgi:CheY-like chemotaxis protein
MPGLGGGELAARFRQLRPDVAVLYLTGYTDETIERQVGMDGSGALLVKPFSPATLSGKIRHVLDERQADAT